MIRSGDTLENPVTGERIVFRKTAADTGGALVLVECVVQPGGAVAAAHVHPHQEERFEVLRGASGSGSAARRAWPVRNKDQRARRDTAQVLERGSG